MTCHLISTRHWKIHSRAIIVVAFLDFAAMTAARGQIGMTSQRFSSTATGDRGAVSLTHLPGEKTNDQEQFVITHGMGGTTIGDRFHVLAAAIQEKLPRAQVMIVDWTDASSARVGFVFCPWKVARRIDAIGAEAARQMTELGVDPNRVTLIGESFGNCVNAEIARKLGGVRRILAFNPANELAGYPTPDLRECAQVSWSFHTFSVFDSLQDVSHATILMGTSPDLTDWQKHVAGIGWLTSRLLANDCSWLLTEKVISGRASDHFAFLATMDGACRDIHVPRKRCERESNCDAVAVSEHEFGR
jgi:pimeloyl-ACP methyl ester carboxylesterase